MLAGVAFVAGLFLALRPLTQQAAVFTAGSAPVRLEVPAGEERAIYVREGTAAQCRLTDSSGRQLGLRPVTGRFTYNEWVAVQRFDTGTGHVTATCTTVPPGASVRIGSLPSIGAFAGGILLSVVGPIALALAGTVVLVVTAVRWFTATGQSPQAPAGSPYPPPPA